MPLGGKREGCGAKRKVDKPETRSQYLAHLKQVQCVAGEAIVRLAEIIRDPESTKKDIIAASVVILDRALPKAIAETLAMQELNLIEAKAESPGISIVVN